MTAAGDDRTNRAFELFDEALDIAAEDLTAWLSERTQGENALAAEVLALLAAHDRQGLLDKPPPATWPTRGEDPVDLVDLEALMQSLEVRIGGALEDRYDSFQRLGHGGMGVVFRARERKHDRSVVIKVLRPEVAIQHGEERFLQEVRLASGLTHPHILAFIDSGKADGLLYYVMPHVDGETLRDRLLRHGPLAPNTAYLLLRDIAAALAYAHEQSVVHRDLKPANILCASDHAYLMDFGIAKALNKVDTEDGLTRPGFSPGTPRYMAPEQFTEGGHTGAPSDVFAWGQLAHEVLTGTLATDTRTPVAIHDRLNALVPDLFPFLAPLIVGALSEQPEDRPTAKEVFDELRLGQSATEPKQSRVRWGLAAAAAVAALVTVTALTGRDEVGPMDVGPLKGRPIAVAGFSNETGDADLDFLGRMAGDWITKGLGDLNGIEVVPWGLAQEVVARAQVDSAVDPVSVLKSETNAGTVITGRYYRVGDQISFRADVTDADGIVVLAATNPVSAPFNQPELAVEELRDRLLGAVSALSGEPSARVSELANHAPRIEAYRAFDHAGELHTAQDYERAKQEYLFAHEQDTTFLPALLGAAASASNVADEQTYDSVMVYLSTRRDRMSRLDDLRWQAFDAEAREDAQAALRVLRETVRIAPADRGTYSLAVLANSLNRPKEALAALDILDPDVGAAKGWAQYWTQLTHSLHLLGRHEEETAAAIEMVRRHPERTVAPTLLARALAASGQIEALDEALLASAVRPPRTYWSHGGALVVAGQALLAHGDKEIAKLYLADAEAWLRVQIEADPEYRPYREWLAEALYAQERWHEAAEVLDVLMVEAPTSSGIRGGAAVMAAWLGDNAKTARLLDPHGWPGTESSRLVYSSRAAAVTGNLDGALSDLSSALDRGVSSFGWLHASGYHEFELMREDPRIARLLQPAS